MPFAFHYAARSDVGMVRSNNEDSAYAGPHLLALADIKRFVNNASLPADATLLSEMDTLIGAFARPAAASIIAQALKDGFQQPGPLELTLGDYINDVRAAPGTLPTR